MKENFIHFLSEQPCGVSINGKNVGFIDNQNNLDINIITNTANVFVTYNPVLESTTAIPYTFVLDCSDTPKSSCEYINIVPFPSNHYDVIMKPFYYYEIKKSETILNENIGNYFVSITSENTSTITIFSGNSVVLKLNTARLISAKCEINNETMIIEGVIDSDTYYLLVINVSDFSILHNDISHSIETTPQYVQTLKKLHNITNHAVVCKVDYTTKESDVFYVYENEYVSMPNNIMLIPYAFLECVKVHDVTGAKQFLSDKYCHTELIQFANYFGDFENVYLNRHDFRQNKLNYTIFANSYKNYNFILDNGKIVDIEEVF